VHENPGTGDREQVFGLVRAAALLPAEAPAVATFAPVLACAGDRLVHETVSKHRMAAVKTALQPDM
jgi:hypothetical protein